MYYIITGETFKQEAIIMACHARVKNERYFYYIENKVTSLYLPGFYCRRISITAASKQSALSNTFMNIFSIKNII